MDRLVPQFVPLNPIWQLQLNELPNEEHVPPFKQGLDAHGDESFKIIKKFSRNKYKIGIWQTCSTVYSTKSSWARTTVWNARWYTKATI